MRKAQTRRVNPNLCKSDASYLKTTEMFDPYLRGYRAFISGKTWDANPYPVGALSGQALVEQEDKRALWEMGWREAQGMGRE